MNLSHLSNEAILTHTINLTASERRIGAEILWHLHAIEQRMIYAELGYSSLFEFTVKHLQYSEGSAHRRIDAMRLLKSFSLENKSEVKIKLESGQLNLTHLAQVQQHIRSSKKPGISVEQSEKLALLQEVTGTSKLQTEKILAAKLPEAPVQPTRVKACGRQKQIVTFELNDEEYAELKELQNLTGGQDLRDTLIKAIKNSLLQERKKREPKNRNVTLKPSTRRVANVPNSAGPSSLESKSSSAVVPSSASSASTQSTRGPVRRVSTVSTPNSESASSFPINSKTTEMENPASGAEKDHFVNFSKNGSKSACKNPDKEPAERLRAKPGLRTRFISIHTKRAVAERDQNRCTFTRFDGKRCESKFGLEFDHLVPYALGGTHAIDNLRLRCKAHNLLHARKVFGTSKMSAYCE